MSERKRVNKRGFDYYEVTLWAVKEEYRNAKGEEEKKYPIVQEIANRAAKRIKELTNEQYTGTQVQSSVSRNLEKLVKNGEVLRVEKKRYVPNCVEYVRDEVMETMVQEVFFKRPDVFFIGENTVVVEIDAQKTKLEKAREFFEKYLGPKSCFGMLHYEEYLVLMLVDGLETVVELKGLVTELVKKCYEKQNAPPPKVRLTLEPKKS